MTKLKHDVEIKLSNCTIGPRFHHSKLTNVNGEFNYLMLLYQELQDIGIERDFSNNDKISELENNYTLSFRKAIYDKIVDTFWQLEDECRDIKQQYKQKLIDAVKKEVA